jgi:2-oxoglutarate ferredoxin oxidoreductase subunit alpha/2-oxoisovalerate ferredoxin oxidoreductase alpha subunit
VTVWPFPIEMLEPLLGRVRRLVVVEASGGQLEDELRLALSHASEWCSPQRIEHVRRQGGVLPSTSEIVEHVEHGPAGGAPRERAS